jgi:hypothetical protein
MTTAIFTLFADSIEDRNRLTMAKIIYAFSFCSLTKIKRARLEYFVSSLMIAVSGGIFVVNIFKHQHIPELFFSPCWETTAIGELRRVFIGAEQTIP